MRILEDAIICHKDWDIDGIRGKKEKQLFHSHFKLAKEWIHREFTPASDIAVLINCSATKPYRKSLKIAPILWICNRYNVDLFVLSEAGVVPICYDYLYPFKYYDWPEEDILEFQDIIIDLLTTQIQDFFKCFYQYKYVISYLPKGAKKNAFINSELDQIKIDILRQENIKVIEKQYPNIAGNEGMFKQRVLVFPITKKLLVDEFIGLGRQKVQINFLSPSNKLIRDMDIPIKGGVALLKEVLFNDFYSLSELFQLTDVSYSTLLFQLNYHLPKKYFVFRQVIDGEKKYKIEIPPSGQTGKIIKISANKKVEPFFLKQF